MDTTKRHKSFAMKGIFPHQWAFTLLIPLRNLFLSPKSLIERMNLLPNMIVLEVGPGPGYFSVPVAKYLTKGKLVLADIQPEMLEKVRKRLMRKGNHNAEYHLCNGENFPFPENYFDRIFMVTVLGEVSNQASYLEEFNRMLKPGGLFSVSEQAGDPDKLSLEEIRQLALDSGFKFNKQYGNKRNFTVNFIK